MIQSEIILIKVIKFFVARQEHGTAVQPWS